MRVGLLVIVACLAWSSAVGAQQPQQPQQPLRQRPPDPPFLQELALRRALVEAEIGRLYRERLATLNAALDVLGSLHVYASRPVAAGPAVAMGSGLLVSEDTCDAVQVWVAPRLPIAGAPGGRGAVQGRGAGCAGCASHGEPAQPLGLGLGLALLLVARARRR